VTRHAADVAGPEWAQAGVVFERLFKDEVTAARRAFFKILRRRVSVGLYL
jgi:hypothetical protein